MIYQIRIRGHLSPQWSIQFEGFSIVSEKNGNTLLTGPLKDQAAMHGILKKIRDCGIPLISLNSINDDNEEGRIAPPVKHETDSL